MRIAEQRLIQRWWAEYAADQEITNTLMREFYVDVVRPSDLYYYGCVFEIFDLLTNSAMDAVDVIDAQAKPAAQAPAPEPAASDEQPPKALPAPERQEVAA